VTAWVQTDAVWSHHHQRRDLHHLTYPVPLGGSGLILLSAWVQGTNLCRVYNYYNSRANDQEQYEILPRLESYWMVCYWMVLVLELVWSRLLVQVCWSVLLSSVGNNQCPLWGQYHCPLWDTPLSVVVFSLNWLVWSVVKLWVERFLDPLPPVNELIFGFGY
jgi:hypothetical protein